MQIEIKTMAKSTGYRGTGKVTPEYFGKTPEAQRFVESLTAGNWTRVPDDLLGQTTAQNFYTYARRAE